MKNEAADSREFLKTEFFPPYNRYPNSSPNSQSGVRINDSWRFNHFPVTHQTNSPRLSIISTPPPSTPPFHAQNDRPNIQENSVLFGRGMQDEGKNLVHGSDQQQRKTLAAEYKNPFNFFDRREARMSEPAIAHNLNEASGFKFQPNGIDHGAPHEGNKIVIPHMQAQHSKTAEEEEVSRGNFKKPLNINFISAPLQVQSKPVKEYFTPKSVKQFQLSTPTNPKQDSPQSFPKNIFSQNHTIIANNSPKFNPVRAKEFIKIKNWPEKLLRQTEYPRIIRQSNDGKHHEEVVARLLSQTNKGILPSQKSQRKAQGEKNMWVPFSQVPKDKIINLNTAPNLSQFQDEQSSAILNASIEMTSIAQNTSFTRVPYEGIGPGNRHRSFEARNFRKIKKLGEGKYGTVHLVIQRTTGFVCALKTISKELIRNGNLIQQFSRELKIQASLSHRNIVSMYGFFSDTFYFYIILQLAQDGQLDKMIPKGSRLKEAEAAKYMLQICQAVNELHNLNIIHRDIKPENIVMHQSVVKLCDFGWSVHQNNELRRTFCGTPLYVSPQVLRGRIYNQKIDIWSLGIMAYQMLIGDSPFLIEKQQEMLKIVTEEAKIPINVQVSKQARDFIKKCLIKNPNLRVGIKELLSHEFITNIAKELTV